MGGLGKKPQNSQFKVFQTGNFKAHQKFIKGFYKMIF